ncbi:MAG: tRNA-dihydrouridine synthase, partial [Alphaproteobacteria bacterium]|nr:tRNA-dihydrouridine synthase [Alphaproteobacteria bacterium]
MRDLPLADEIMQAVLSAVDIPVTVKMRMGWDHDHLNAPELAAKAEQNGVSMVTVHGRTREQKYTGKADWAFIQNVKQAISIPLLANGDINSVFDAREALEKSGADGVMIGRGAQGRPWFLSQVIAYLEEEIMLDSPDFETQRDTLLAHYQGILDHHGSYMGVRVARKHLGWYVKSVPGAASFRDHLMRLSDADEVQQAISEFYAPLIDNQKAAA